MAARLEVGQEGRGSTGENPAPQRRMYQTGAKILALEHWLYIGAMGGGWDWLKQMISLGQPIGDREAEN